jgi:hypothetical protein
MPSKKVTYGDIEHLFESEGFTRKAVKTSHILFEMPGSKAALVLPAQRASAAAAKMHLAMVKRTLVDFGLLTEADIDRWIADPKHFQAA